MSLKWTRHNESNITWWGPNNSGYVWNLDLAGKYTEEQVRRIPDYYDNRAHTIAVPCEIADAYANRMVTLGSADAIVSKTLGRTAGVRGSVTDDKDHEGRDECPHCERGYGRPGPMRLLDSASKAAS